MYPRVESEPTSRRELAKTLVDRARVRNDGIAQEARKRLLIEGGIEIGVERRAKVGHLRG